jgi:hypothetical protein
MLQLFVEFENWELALSTGKGGGHIGWTLAVIVIKLFGFWAGIILVLALLIIGLMLMFNTNLATLFRGGTMPARLLARPFSILLNRNKEAEINGDYEEEEENKEESEAEEEEVDDSFSLKAIKDETEKTKITSQEKILMKKPTGSQLILKLIFPLIY